MRHSTKADILTLGNFEQLFFGQIDHPAYIASKGEPNAQNPQAKKLAIFAAYVRLSRYHIPTHYT